MWEAAHLIDRAVRIARSQRTVTAVIVPSGGVPRVADVLAAKRLARHRLDARRPVAAR